MSSRSSGPLAGESDSTPIRRARDLESASLEPSSLLVDFADLFQEAPRGSGLDVACGNGRNSFFLASLGYDVLALDISEAAVAFVNHRAKELGVRVQSRGAALEVQDLGEQTFAVIMNFLFLDRNLVPRMTRALVPGGLLFFETFTVEERSLLGRDIRLDYLLGPNELLRLFAPLRILYFREGVLGMNTRHPRAVAQLIARKI